MSNQLPIHDLIETQQTRLGIRRRELARRCGFKNISKGIRRIDGVCQGDLASQGAKMVIAALPTALEVEETVVDAAIRETGEIVSKAEEKALAEREAVWRASFKPCAYLVGTESRPSSITMYGLSGGANRWLKIPLDLSQPPVTFAAQAHAVVKKTPAVPFFGRTTGFIVNYTPDSAVRFGLDGNPAEHFDRAYLPGEVELFLGRRRVPTKTFATVLGIGWSDD
jgi:hypothetical protein